ncbi:MAG: polyketide cyclase [Pseudonocardiales bacterium]|nr:MAG: polyketide cyclase [Pseudonocardiales bacterium]
MISQTPSEFSRQYLETWTEPDPERRRANLERMWSADGRMVVSSIGVTPCGIDEIAAHIARVHEQNIAGRGLRFVYDQDVEADDALLLRWSMLASDDSAVGRGVDVVFRDADGRVQTVYMFMGID